MRIDRLDLRLCRLPLVSFFETSFGRSYDRTFLLVRLEGEGHEGWGEAVAEANPYYSSETTETAWHIITEFLAPRVLGRAFEHPREIFDAMRPIRGHNMAKAALEMAAWDLYARSLAQPLSQVLGGTRARIASGVSIGIQDSLDQLQEKIDQELAAGYQRIKIKIKPGWDVDVVREVRRAFPKILLMCDANSAYTLADTPAFQKMDEYDVMMFEQPLHYEDMIDHAELQRHIRTPICLDESIHSAEDARKAIAIGACRIINIKLGRVGGYREARAVHDVCLGSGIPVWCGGMLESGIGRAHNVALSSLENFSLPGDVAASKRYWPEDVVDPPIEVSPEGHILQSMASGIGYQIRQSVLESFTVRTQVFGA